MNLGRDDVTEEDNEDANDGKINDVAFDGENAFVDAKNIWPECIAQQSCKSVQIFKYICQNVKIVRTYLQKYILCYISNTFVKM